jgi:hypothetical protein
MLGFFRLVHHHEDTPGKTSIDAPNLQALHFEIGNRPISNADRPSGFYMPEQKSSH